MLKGRVRTSRRSVSVVEAEDGGNAGGERDPDGGTLGVLLMLHKVSRSFALVIQQLGTELRDAMVSELQMGINIKHYQACLHGIRAPDMA
ncbi:hypothetical protein E3N88_18582 [Mikania micrantha]|uniref:Uncharacterized protein n=1 Tax=Mikania micrantha TaxID=192012 RepID=A0A5N6NKU4_9ASTR|nr:hypothetical protein E3N88_18582 [Mikania micrantha]